MRNKSPHVTESKAVFDSGFHAVDSGSQLLDSKWIISEIPDSLGSVRFRIPRPRIPESKSKNLSDSGQVQIPLHEAKKESDDVFNALYFSSNVFFILFCFCF